MPDGADELGLLDRIDRVADQAVDVGGREARVGEGGGDRLGRELRSRCGRRPSRTRSGPAPMIAAHRWPRRSSGASVVGWKTGTDDRRRRSPRRSPPRGMPMRTSDGSTSTRLASTADPLVEIDEHRDHRVVERRVLRVVETSSCRPSRSGQLDPCPVRTTWQCRAHRSGRMAASAAGSAALDGRDASGGCRPEALVVVGEDRRRTGGARSPDRPGVVQGVDLRGPNPHSARSSRVCSPQHARSPLDDPRASPRSVTSRPGSSNRPTAPIVSAETRPAARALGIVEERPAERARRPPRPARRRVESGEPLRRAARPRRPPPASSPNASGSSWSRAERQIDAGMVGSHGGEEDPVVVGAPVQAVVAATARTGRRRRGPSRHGRPVGVDPGVGRVQEPGVDDRGAHRLAFAGPLTVVQRGRDGDGRQQGVAGVAHVRPAPERRVAGIACAVLPFGTRQGGGRLIGTGQVGPGALLVAAGVAVDRGAGTARGASRSRGPDGRPRRAASSW